MPLIGSNGTFYPTTTIGGGAATTFTVDFNPSIRFATYGNASIAVKRGGLLYALWIGQNISVTAQYAYQSQDLAVTATQPWNLALVANLLNPSAGLTFNQVNGVCGDVPALNLSRLWTAGFPLRLLRVSIMIEPVRPLLLQVSRPSSEPFSSTAIPVTITGTARQVLAWGTQSNAAATPPLSPACANQSACGTSIPVTLVPFGSTHVRMAVLPWA